MLNYQRVYILYIIYIHTLYIILYILTPYLSHIRRGKSLYIYNIQTSPPPMKPPEVFGSRWGKFSSKRAWNTHFTYKDMTYEIWYVTCDVWCMMYDVWCMMYDMYSVYIYITYMYIKYIDIYTYVSYMYIIYIQYLILKKKTVAFNLWSQWLPGSPFHRSSKAKQRKTRTLITERVKLSWRQRRRRFFKGEFKCQVFLGPYMGKPIGKWENIGKPIAKWENIGKPIGKWENIGNLMGS